MVAVHLRRCCVGNDPVDENEAISVVDGGCLVVEVGSVGRYCVEDC